MILVVFLFFSIKNDFFGLLLLVFMFLNISTRPINCRLNDKIA